MVPGLPAELLGLNNMSSSSSSYLYCKLVSYWYCVICGAFSLIIYIDCPISNTEVKLSCADNTWREAAWECRSLPVWNMGCVLQPIYGPMVKRLRHRPFTAVTRVRFPVGSPNRTEPSISYDVGGILKSKILYARLAELSENLNLWFSYTNLYEVVKWQTTLYARLAELADALDLGSSGRPWGFKSLIAHQ